MIDPRTELSLPLSPVKFEQTVPNQRQTFRPMTPELTAHCLRLSFALIRDRGRAGVCHKCWCAPNKRPSSRPHAAHPDPPDLHQAIATSLAAWQEKSINSPLYLLTNVVHVYVYTTCIRLAPRNHNMTCRIKALFTVQMWRIVHLTPQRNAWQILYVHLCAYLVPLGPEWTGRRVGPLLLCTGAMTPSLAYHTRKILPPQGLSGVESLVPQNIWVKSRDQHK